MPGMHHARVRGVTYTDRMTAESKARARRKKSGCVLMSVLMMAMIIFISFILL